ncbi:MAG: D-alanyl-lipoteichoic acid biosynthesis protein DltD [Streptococcus sp.]
MESQGFTNIADFSKDGDQPYFMEDTIHMGWNGWLAFDKSGQSPLSQRLRKSSNLAILNGSLLQQRSALGHKGTLRQRESSNNA